MGPAAAGPIKDVKGWLQTMLIITTTVGSVFLGYGNLNAKADAAVKEAAEAKKIADNARESLVNAREELVRIRTVLEERLPRRPLEAASPAGSR